MGQGYSLTTLSAGSAGIDVPELSDVVYEKALGDARFMKAIRARHRDGSVVAKVVMKPYASMKFSRYIKKIISERNALTSVPNALGYHRAFETSSNGYLVRQYIYSSIYDRMSTRPFLEDIEKRWLAFQILSAIRDCHAKNIYHGDIKTENTLVTSWNWLYLSDFSSSFKPTYLPEDNPADFSFFFDISGRRTCYLAPERFLSPGEKADGRGGVTWAMDVFSAGCVIAELFLEAPIFNLSQLFRYRKGDYDPVQIHLSRIEDPEIREMVAHMIQVEPESRYSADEYLNFWRHKAFPEYFYSFLHQYMHLLTDFTSGHASSASETNTVSQSDGRIDRIYHDFDKISFFLGYDDHEKSNVEDGHHVPNSHPSSLFPLHLDMPNKRQIVSARAKPDKDDGTLLFLNMVTSGLRSTARATARVRACELLLAFAEKLTDDAKLDRVLPYAMALISDRSDLVKVAALRTITQLVALVTTASPVNAYLFPEYILPRLEIFTPLSGPKHTPLVRIAYAACVATLAETASRFLDVIQALKAEGSLPATDPETEDGMFTHAYQNLFDTARADLIKFFEAQTKALLTDSDPDVRRAFLSSVSSLCVFFGSAKANDVILSHLNTYLNDRDWKLKCAFFETIVGVAIYVGGTSLEEFILPLMIQALSDPEEFVVEKVVRSLATMAKLGLFQRSRTWELLDLTSRFTMHPNFWIREAAADFISSTTNFLSVADCHCIVRPLLNPYTRLPPTSFSELDLLDALKKPLPRIIFDMAVAWASKVEKGIFWKASQQRITSAAIHDRIHVTPTKGHGGSNALAKIPKNEEDNQWISRLRNAGMRAEDEFKLLALRDYIWRMSKRRTKEDIESVTQKFNKIVSLHDLGIKPVTVFFDHQQQTYDDMIAQNEVQDVAKQPQTISDALLDASTTLDEFDSRDASPADIERADRRLNAVTAQHIPDSSNDASPRVSSPLSASPMTAGIWKTERDHLKIPGTTETTTKSPASLSSNDESQASKDNQGRTNAMDLMLKKSTTGKAIAETSMSSATAFGKVDTADTRNDSSKSTNANDEVKNKAPAAKFVAAHSYEGKDPTVLRLLDSLYLDNYPSDVAEFGPSVIPIERRQWEKKIGTSKWRPSGNLVALFNEHTAAVSRVVVAPDHSFFITGSDDGSVKVWDSTRLERNLAHRSRQTHKHASGSRVTSLCFVENTHCFVSAADDGSITVVKVDYSETAQGSTRYGKLKTLRQWQIPRPSSYAVWMDHFRDELASTLILATNTSEIIALDLKTLNVLYTLNTPVDHGHPTSFCLDARHHWLLLGNSHGILDLWDLRFQLRIRSWGFPGAYPIHRVSLHPVRGTKKRQVCIAGGTGATEITVWDLEKLICREVYRVAPRSSSTTPAPSKQANTPLKITSTSIKPYTPWFPDSAPADTMLSRFAMASPLEPGARPSSQPTPSSSHDHSVRAFAVGARASSDANDAQTPSHPRHGFLLAAGPDRKVRFWDMDRVENSCIVSGADLDDSTSTTTAAGTGTGTGTGATTTTTTNPSSSPNKDVIYLAGQAGPECVVCEERMREHEAGERSSKTTPARKEAVLSLQQQQTVLKAHLDVVLDVALLEFPLPMVVSTDRGGGVYVFS